MDQLYIHIGYPKTGTSLLQQHIFPEVDAINFIWHWDHPVILELSKVCNQDEFGFNTSTTLENINKHLQSGTTFISYESLIGDVYMKLINSRLIANRLKAMFPHAKIIITLRNQYDLIVSLYKQYINQGGTERFSKLVGFRNGKFIPTYTLLDQHLNIAMFRFAPLLNHYTKIFGADNVHILLYEDLKADAHKFVREMLTIMNVQEEVNFENKYVNKSYGGVQLEIQRFFNHFLRSPLNRHAIVPFPSIQRKLRLALQSDLSLKMLGSRKRDYPEIRSRIRQYFHQHNKELNTRYNLNMDLYGHKYYN